MASTLELNWNREIAPIIKRRTKQNNLPAEKHQQSPHNSGQRLVFDCCCGVRHRRSLLLLPPKKQINELENFIKMRSPLITVMRSTFPQRNPTGSGMFPALTPTYASVLHSLDNIQNNCFSLDFFLGRRWRVLWFWYHCFPRRSSRIQKTQRTHICIVVAAFVRLSRCAKFGDLISHFWAWKASTHTHICRRCRCHCLLTVCGLGLGQHFP